MPVAADASSAAGVPVVDILLFVGEAVASVGRRVNDDSGRAIRGLSSIFGRLSIRLWVGRRWLLLFSLTATAKV